MRTTYIHEIESELTGSYIRFWEKKEWLIKLREGFYNTNELMRELISWVPAKTQHKTMKGFCDLVWTKFNNIVRRRTISGTYSYIPEGYYDKPRLIDYILERLK